MVDRDRIYHAYRKYFAEGDPTLTIDKSGLISINGSCTLKKYTTMLPVRFAEVTGDF